MVVVGDCRHGHHHSCCRAQPLAVFHCVGKLLCPCIVGWRCINQLLAFKSNLAFGWLGRTRWGLPGVHGFYAGNDWELFRHIRPGDRISAIERVVGVEEKESKFSGRLVLQYVEASYFNQRGELLARGLATRLPRMVAEAVARQGGKRIRHTGAQMPDVSGSGDPALRR